MTTEADEAEEFDLSDVPMDDVDDDQDADDGVKEAEDEEEGEAKPKAAAKKGVEGEAEGEARAKLTPEELEERYSNTKTALAQERRERREAVRKNTELEARLTALESGGAPKRAAEAAEEEEIDPDIDPIGAMKQMRNKIAAYEAVQRQEEQSEAEAKAQERKFQAVEAKLAEHEEDFRDDHPDYDDAAKHYAGARAQELLSYGLKPQQVQKTLREEFATLAATAINNRKNPAAVVYELAKARGFGKAKGEDPAPKGKPGKAQVSELIRGAKASSPLSRSGGRASTGLDAATVANINIRDRKGGEAFDAAFERMETEAKRAERGRR